MKHLPHLNDRRAKICRACVLIAACAYGPSLAAQDTRADLLAREQAARAHELEASVPTGPGWLERAFTWGESKLQMPTGARDGFYPELGGMIPGSGLSAGPGYRLHLFGTRAIVDASGAVSWNQYTMLQSRIEWPRLLMDRLAVGAQAKYQDFTQINFFGVGADSLKENETNYRLKDVDILGFASVRPNQWLTIDGRAGVLERTDIAAGTSALSPSTSDRFDEAAARGLAEQPDFLHADVSVAVDTQDEPSYPSSGGRYQLSLASFHDWNFSRYSFRRLEVDAAQYVPLFHKSWVLALHGRAVVSQTAAGQDVPFYMLPTLGGSNTLRGYSNYRFRDRDLLLFSAEYRWPLFLALDGALFYDAGTVAPSVQALSSSRAHADYGAGVRLHTTKRTLARVDVARSAEGVRALFAFTAPLGAPSRSVAPYVP